MILEEYNFQYYEEYKRLYQTAFLLSLQLKNLSETKDELWQKLGRLEVPSLTIVEKNRRFQGWYSWRTARKEEKIQKNCWINRQKLHMLGGKVPKVLWIWGVSTTAHKIKTPTALRV